MQYLLLIYSNEAEEAAMKPALIASIMAEYTEFTKGIVQSVDLVPMGVGDPGSGDSRTCG